MPWDTDHSPLFNSRHHHQHAEGSRLHLPYEGFHGIGCGDGFDVGCGEKDLLRQRIEGHGPGPELGFHGVDRFVVVGGEFVDNGDDAFRAGDEDELAVWVEAAGVDSGAGLLVGDNLACQRSDDCEGTPRVGTPGTVRMRAASAGSSRLFVSLRASPFFS